MVLNEKGIIKQFSLVVYNQGILAVIGDMEEQVNKLYKPKDTKYNWIAAPDEGHLMAAYDVIEKKTGIICYMIWCKDVEQFRGSYLCHECGHAALELFHYIGAKANYDDQEPFCYLLGTIFRLINGTFYEYKDFIDKKSKNKSKSKKK